MKEKIELIIKFLCCEANVFELEQLNDILDKKKNKRVFEQLVEIHYLLSLSMKKYNVEKAKLSFRKKIKKEVAKIRLIRFSKYASAACVLFFIVTYQFVGDKENTISLKETTSQGNVEAGGNRAILTLENGNQVVLEEGKAYNSDKAIGNGKSLEYKKGNKKNEDSFNYLTIPRGGQFKLTLPDGTEVWLNSDSKLKYPIAFEEHGPREVELLYGEIFMKVSPSSENNGNAFNLKTKEQVVQVLGTEFNVRAYQDEAFSETTLVEGSVMLKVNNNNTKLVPNEQAFYNYDTGTILVETVNVSNEISWVDGLFSFDSESLEDIMKTLARWYDVEVVFESGQLKDFIFTGILERSSSIDDVLKHLEASREGELKFIIDDRTILINNY